MMREFSAGGIVWKRFKDPKTQRHKDLFLVRRAVGGGDYRGSLGWTLPKGWIDAGEKPEETAVREVGEEGGVEAKIISKLETIKIFFADVNTKEKIMKFITYYLMEWVRDLDEGHDWETAEVKWITVDEVKELAYSSERKLVLKAFELVQSRSEKS